VGYSGGEKEWPTYKKILDHTETIRVEYNPSKISYEALLEMFLKMQDGGPRYKSYSRQYRSVLLPHTSAQRATAETFMNRAQVEQNRQLFVDIEDGGDFYRAEEYHQKFIDKQKVRFN
jgi:peptide-methionine (S)-S-oxide reductase